MASQFTFAQRVQLAIVPRLAAFLIWALGKTWRFHETCEPGALPCAEMPRPGIYAFWHRSLLMTAYYFRNLGAVILISQSFDGELIARTIELLGFKTVRGSSTRGGAAGLIAIERAYRGGDMVAVTADGPKGPMYVAKPGVARLAQRVDGEVRALGVLPENAWVLKSWDRFLIPRPFSRVEIYWTTPVRVGDQNNDDVQAALDRGAAMAESQLQTTR